MTTSLLVAEIGAGDPGAQVRRNERPGGAGTAAQVTGIGAQVRRNGRPGRVGIAAQVAPERAPGCERNTHTVADVLERSLFQSVTAAPSSLREQLAQELEALARLLRHRRPE